MSRHPIDAFFESNPAAKPLFDALTLAILDRFPKTSFKIQKSQIALMDEKPYAAVWLPVFEVKNRPKTYLILSFGLDMRLTHERLIEVNEPYPGRFMHHTLISRPDDLDVVLMGWLELALDYTKRKGTR